MMQRFSLQRSVLRNHHVVKYLSRDATIGTHHHCRRYYSSLTLWNQSNSRATHISSTSLIVDDISNRSPSSLSNPSSPLYRLDQIRHMGRKDGHSAFYKIRPSTRKQRKKYYKRKREEYQHQIGRHSKPGSKAGPRREYKEIQRQNLVDLGAGRKERGLLPENMDYNYGDALVDDLMGNTESLAAAPTPKPLNMGRQYKYHYSLVKGLMDDYHKQLEIEKNNEKKNDDNETNDLSTPLPTDKQISLLLRSYQDKYSTRSKPLGIVKALQHLVAEIKIPTSLYAERTYSALMYCAASPKEARRIMKMMEENGHPPGSYAYSILVDIYAKRGDFRGADEVISEMVYESVEPTLAAYTSLLAACYKAINTAEMPQSIKAEAGTLAWERWKELRINGLDADVMAYGAIIRIMAARGLPERAINILEEMQMMDVKPTSLVFTAALRSVARSHANALRFSGGFSKKDKRRESITAHHGKMTRRIVILAEQAEVKQDDGFTSALMICAATAGDSATTKAIYLASEVRKLEHLRPIGGAEHLRLFHDFDEKQSDDLLGIDSDVQNLKITDGELNHDEALLDNQHGDPSDNSIESIASDEIERKHLQIKTQRRKRKDTRKLTALLRANANAVERKGLGSMWQGTANKGFLCENSLRLLTARYQPKYVDKSIPGISGTESGLASMIWDEDEDAHLMGKRLRRKKFMGLLEDTDDNRIDDLDPMLYKLFVEDEDDDEYDDEGQDAPLGAGANAETNGELDEFLEEEPNVSLEQNHVKSIPNYGQNEELDNEEQFTVTDEFDGNNIDSVSKEDVNVENVSLTGLMTNPNEKSAAKQHLSDPLNEVESTVPSVISNKELSIQDSSDDDEQDELSLILHGMPPSRIKKVRQEFQTSLGDPSLLSLVPLLRENLPEVITMKWLREKNIKDAQFVMDKAKEDKVVDTHIMNSMLQVFAKAGKVDDVLALHNEEFSLNNIEPSAYSDRSVFQMLVSRHRISRALDFKEKMESKGKQLDLLSYGSLIEYFGNNDQIGSAISMLKECKMIHGSPPGEKNLKQLRIKCRQKGLVKAVGLEELIGKDPIDWVKKGENEFKREYSKKGRRQVLHATNKLVSI